MAEAKEKINRRPLTRIQLQHAERRLSEAHTRQVNALIEKHKKPEPLKLERLGDAQFYRAVATGKLKLRPLADIGSERQSYWTPMESLRQAFAAPADMAKKKAYDAAVKNYNETVAKATKTIDIRFQNALDALYLSDADKAMDIVEQFAEGK